MTEVEKYFQELKERAENASPEDKERGKRIASNWRISRLSYQHRRELQHANHLDGK